MAQPTTVTVLGLYQWSDTLFDHLVLPDGLDRDLLISKILQEASAFELVYPDFAYMQDAIAIWSRSSVDIWTRLYATEKLVYDPIENYNRHEEYSDTHSTSYTDDNFVNNQVAGYNSNQLVTQSHVYGENNSNGDMTIKHDAHLYGNIGVTTTQQMIAEERDSVQFCTYDFITNDFLQKFCIQVY